MTQAYPWQQTAGGPGQQWQGAPAGPPQNGPVGPPQQMEAPMAQGDAAGFFSTSKSFLFNAAKDPSCMRRWRGGQIINPPRREQCRVYQQDGSTGPLAYWDEEKTRPKWQLIVTVASDERDATDPSDTGHRSLYIKEGTDLYRKLKACPTSVRMAPSDWLWVNYYMDDPTSKGSIPAKLFDVVHAIRPGDYGYGQPPTHVPGGGQQVGPPAQQPAAWAQQSGPAPTPDNPWGNQQPPAPVQPSAAWRQAPAAAWNPPAGPPNGQQVNSLAQVPWPPPDAPAQSSQQPPPWVVQQQTPPWVTQQG
jgi:hypothetical protein